MRSQTFFIIVCIILSLNLLSLNSFAQTRADTEKLIILVLGDSLSAGFGIDQSKSWVSLLTDRLQNNGAPYTVYNASISGETSAGGLSRLPALLKQNPRIVIIELGTNDGLRGLPLAELKNNLEQMIKQAKEKNAKILLLGMKLPPNYGPAYTNGFQKIFSDLAGKYKLKLVPFFLSGIATQRHLMQDDNLHPTADAQPLILENIWPQLKPLIR